MLASELDNDIRTLRAAAIKVAWRQWAALGVPVTGEQPARALIDPEALVLASFALQAEERRLPRLLRLWLPSGVRLLSVQRFRNLLPTFAQSTQVAASGFGRLAMMVGKDARWRSVTKPDAAAKPEAADPRHLASPAVDRPAALLLRLRLGLGIGVKPDLVGYLIGLAGQSATVQELADAVAYRQHPVRRAAEELAAAGLIEGRQTAPASWRIRVERWRPLLDLPEDPPVWRPWRVFFTFVDHMSALAEQAEREKWSPYLHSSRLRDVFEAQSRSLARHHLMYIDPDRYRGEELLVGGSVQASQLAEWALAVA